MIRRPPRSTLDRSSAASDVYKRQAVHRGPSTAGRLPVMHVFAIDAVKKVVAHGHIGGGIAFDAVSYTHLRAHETVLDLVCRLLLEKKKT